jgi:hypothetical protein
MKGALRRAFPKAGNPSLNIHFTFFSRINIFMDFEFFNNLQKSLGIVSKISGIRHRQGFPGSLYLFSVVNKSIV